MRTVALLVIVLTVLHINVTAKGLKSFGATVTKSGLEKRKLSSGLEEVSSTIQEGRVVAADASSRWNGPLCILGGALGHLALGTLYCWGNFLSYIPPKLRFLDGGDRVGQPDAIYVVSLSLVAQALAMPFGPTLTSKFGASGAFLFGTWMMAFGTYMASFFTEDLKKYMIFYSLFFGAGSGFAYTAPMSAGWKWLPHSKGLVSGGILTGFGFGGFIFALIGSSIANPNGFDKDLETGRFPVSVYKNFPKMLRRLAVVYAGLSLVGSLMLTEPKTDNDTDTSSESAKKGSVIAPGYTIRQAVCTRQFWTMWAMVVCSATCGLNTASIYKQFAGSEPNLHGDTFQATVGGIAAIFNGTGRLAWGLLSDAIGFKNSFTILTIIQGIFMGVYKYSAARRSTFLANTCALFFCLAGNLALMPAAVQRVFGPNRGAAIYGVMFSAFAVASTVGSTVTKKLAVSIGWSGVFTTLATMSLVATAITQTLTPLPESFSSV